MRNSRKSPARPSASKPFRPHPIRHTGIEEFLVPHPGMLSGGELRRFLAAASPEVRRAVQIWHEHDRRNPVARKPS